ncbi:MAG: endonuclease [Bacilli bacterium]|nr:endonuclease [Bacilli bacterium]
MKREVHKIISVILGSSLLIGLGVAFNVNNISKNDEVSGYSASSLPTTIDLNDTSEEDIRDYYSNLSSLVASERKGTNLLKNLKPILMLNQKYYNYDSGDNIWKMYEITDRDWKKSPASGITTYGQYNATTNTITNYSYGSNSSPNSNPYIHALYVNRNITNETRAWGSHGDRSDPWTIEREHIWAKANGFEKSGAGGARGDPMHLWAANGTSNGEHSNHFFGYVDTTKSYVDSGSTHSNLKGNLTGISKTYGGSSKVFEPQDCDKGDIARAIFYMVARYNNYAGSTSETFDSNNPNLALVDSPTPKSTSGYSSTSTETGTMGIVSDLLEWNRLDPPDEYEIHRNNILYTNFTNNRNPFIDFLEWAEYIWGTNSSGKYATPVSDNINSFGTSETISVESISLQETTSVSVNKTTTLIPSFVPSNATNKAVNWSTSNSGVATVSNGVITGISVGSAVITATTVDGNKTATCTVTVKESSVSDDQKTVTINYGDTFDPALPTASGSVNTTPTLHADTTASISFKEQYIYKGNSSSYLMFHKDSGNAYLYNTENLGTIDSVKVTYSSGVSVSAMVGVYFGSTEQSTYTSASNKTIAGQSQSDTWTNTTEGNGFFQISTSNKNCQITNIEITYHPCLSSIQLSNQTTSFDLDSEFEFDGLVTAKFDGGDDLDVTSKTSFSGYDMSSVGVQTVTASYTHNGVTKTANYQITINEVNTVNSVSLSSSNLSFDLSSDSLTSQLVATVETTGSQASKTVTWSSSNQSVASVSNNGLVTALSIGHTVITATSTYDNSMTANCEVTVTDSSSSSESSYSLFTGNIEEGDYLITYNNCAMKASVTSNRLSFSELTITDGVIDASSVDSSLVWHISPSEDYWTIYNEFESKYASSTGAKNQAALSADIDDKAKWAITGSSTYEFVNKNNSASGVNSNLRKNGTYGFACYSTSTGGALTLYKVSGEAPVDTNESPYINGYAYEMYFTNSSGNHYFSHSMSGYYGATVSEYSTSYYVYFEKGTSGQYLYFVNGEGKQYISIKLKDTHINFTYSTTKENAEWKYSSNYGFIYQTIDGTDYTIGSTGSYNTFGGYRTNNSGLFKVQFMETAETYSYHFLNNMTCDSAGENSPIFEDGYSWSNLKTKFNALVSVESNILVNASSNENGTIIEQAMKRYDYLVEKYGYENFIGRNVSSKNSLILTISNDNQNNILVILIILGLVTVGTAITFVYRKHKQD